MSKEVIVRQLPSKKPKGVVIETPEEPQQVKTIEAPAKPDLKYAMSVLKDLGFKVSPPEIEVEKKTKKKSAKVRVQVSESESESEEEQVVVKTKKRIEKKIPKKREEKEEEDDEEEYVQLPPVKPVKPMVSSAPVNTKQVMQAQQPIAPKPQPVQIGVGSNPLARRLTPFGLPL